MSSPRATVAILSIGDMGFGVARLLQAHGYRVVTNVSARSEYTQKRVRAALVESLSSDVALVQESDYILSIVPQRDARSVAERVLAAANAPEAVHRDRPLYFIDLNAVSPKTARSTAQLLAGSATEIKFIDGGIIGNPPRKNADGSWFRPRLVVSGPLRLDQAEKSGAHLAETLNMQHIDEKIGSASALKMCFASLSKGFAAIAIQSVTTAEKFGINSHLQDLLQEFNPGFAGTVHRVVPSVPPKAYRWVQEMLEISDTFEEEGLFAAEQSLFKPISKLYDYLANHTVLGEEKVGHRKRGTTVEDVAEVLLKANEERKES